VVGAVHLTLWRDLAKLLWDLRERGIVHIGAQWSATWRCEVSRNGAAVVESGVVGGGMRHRGDVERCGERAACAMRVP
jgi:hypothetical protein